MSYNRIIKPERDTQNRAIEAVLTRLQSYTYLGNLETMENANIREDDVAEFLRTNQHCSSAEIADALRQLKEAAACPNYKSLYDKGLETYQALRNGIQVSNGYGRVNRTISFIDWRNPLNNRFAIAEEVTVRRLSEDTAHRRPDIVVYVNGIALVVLELKKVSVSVADAIRQNRRNQQDGEICHFFTTVQLLLAGNESEGIKYAVTKTPEEYWLHWKEPTGSPCDPSQFTQQEFPNEMFRSLLQLLEPHRLLEMIHDCIIYDGGIKKVARPNQYFALAAAKRRIAAHESGIIWHSQGSGKSLTMVWLAQWIKEQGDDARIVIITDRDELDKQIEKGFKNTGKAVYRATSGQKLIDALNQNSPGIICTLIHKFGIGLHEQDNDRIAIGEKKAHHGIEECLEAVAEALPKDFQPKGKIFAFVDECHRTQSGILHRAMCQIMGEKVMTIGFTGTPLLKESKLTSIEQFGTFIHTYKFDEAVRDQVILDLRYESRNVEQQIDSNDQQAIDRVFDAKTANMTERAKAALKNKWATMQNLYSSQDRLRRIVGSICEDMVMENPLAEGYGNAMLVAGSIYEAYKYWDLFETTELKGKTTVVSSYDPAAGISIQQGYSSDQQDEEAFKYNTAKRMMGNRNAEEHEEWAKEQFINKPESMKLIIVRDKLLTGFDAPHATYLYIDKHMEDHNLFQAICRVNRLDGERKEFGYIIDFKDLFNEIKQSIEDYTNGYTNGAFKNFDKEDVEGLLKNRLTQGKEDLDNALEQVRGITIAVKQPREVDNFFDYFVFDQQTTPPEEEQAASLENAAKREVFYDAVLTLTNRYLAIATMMTQAGYTSDEAKAIHQEVQDYDRLQHAIMLRSGDATDLKQYNAMMRQLLDRYVQAPRTNVLEKIADLSFLDMLDKNPDNDSVGDIIKEEKETGEHSGAETIASTARKIIIRKHDANPAYYDQLSQRLVEILRKMKDNAEDYRNTLHQLIETLRAAQGNRQSYPAVIDTDGKKALFDNLGKDETLALQVYQVIRDNAEQGFRQSKPRQRRIKMALRDLVSQEQLPVIMQIIINNEEF